MTTQVFMQYIKVDTCTLESMIDTYMYIMCLDYA